MTQHTTPSNTTQPHTNNYPHPQTQKDSTVNKKTRTEDAEPSDTDMLGGTGAAGTISTMDL